VASASCPVTIIIDYRLKALLFIVTVTRI